MPTNECGLVEETKMRLPQDLDTVEPIPFAGGTGLEIWCTVSVAHEGDVDALRGILDVNPDLVHCGWDDLL